ncbi:MAG: AsmA-like C-terminal region-containing protein, partial [Bacteroidota bacterium]
GKLNLAEVQNFVKLDAGTTISGLLAADAFAKGELAGVQNGGGPFSAGGFMELSNLYFASPQLPQPVKNGSAKIAITNQGGVADATTINVSSAHLQIGNNPIDFNLMISKPISEILFSGAAKGRLSLGDIKQFIALEQGTVVSGMLDADMSFNGSKADIDKGNYEKIGLSGQVNFANVNYKSAAYPDGVQVKNASLQFNPQTVQLHNFNGTFQNTNLAASGVLQNVIGYALNKESLLGNINVAASKINLNNWMTTDTAATSGKAAAAAVAVPANINITLNAKADEVHYDKVDYRNVKGTLLVKDETVTLQNVFTNALDGDITFNGAYSTKVNKQKPEISLNYTVKDVDVQKAFYAFNTVQKLMPAGKFLSGKISSQFSMIGKLNGDMMPDLTSLTGNGNLLLIQGVLAKFQPLEKLAGVLNVAELTEVSLKDIKSHFEFANGKVLVKPFSFKIKEIELQVGGMHGFDQSMDYIIGMKLPRKYLGTSGNALINNLTTQANSKGIPVTVSDMVDLNRAVAPAAGAGRPERRVVG